MNLKTIEKIGLGKISRHCTVDCSRHVAFAMLPSGHILCSETNKRSTNGSITRWTIHAEENLVKKLRKIKAVERLGNIDVLVMRFDKMGGWRMSKPCQKCESLMRNYGIRKIFYSSFNGDVILNPD